jgi:hypothetical protein
MKGVSIVISSTERASLGIIGCTVFPSLGARARRHGLPVWTFTDPVFMLRPSVANHHGLRNDGPGDRLVRRFRVLRVGSEEKRP